MLNDETKHKILKLFDELLDGISISVSNLTLNEVLAKSKPLTLELFSQNIHEYFYFITAQRVTKSFSTRLGTVIEKVSAILVESQGGQIVKGDPKPFDLKFIHPDGLEYWIEIKSINAQNSSNMKTIQERRELAQQENCKFYLCIYNDNRISSEEFKLNGNDFWKLVGGEVNTGDDIFSLLNGLAKDIKIKEIVDFKADELTQEYIRNLEKFKHFSL